MAGAAAQARRAAGRVPAALWCCCRSASLSAGAGLAAAVALLAFGPTRTLGRSAAVLGPVLAANAPWLVSGLLHAVDGDHRRRRGRGLRAPRRGVAARRRWRALGLGGIWNAEVVPGSRDRAAGCGHLVVVACVLAAVGAPAWWRRGRRGDEWPRPSCWLLGWGSAVLTWAAPGPMAWAVAHVPGAGLLRDGSRLLLLCVPLLLVRHRVRRRRAVGRLAVRRAVAPAGTARRSWCCCR